MQTTAEMIQSQCSGSTNNRAVFQMSVSYRRRENTRITFIHLSSRSNAAFRPLMLVVATGTQPTEDEFLLNYGM